LSLGDPGLSDVSGAWAARLLTLAPVSLRTILLRGTSDGLGRLKRWHMGRNSGDAVVRLHCAAQKPGALRALTFAHVDSIAQSSLPQQGQRPLTV